MYVCHLILIVPAISGCHVDCLMLFIVIYRLNDSVKAQVKDISLQRSVETPQKHDWKDHWSEAQIFTKDKLIVGLRFQ